MEQLSTNNLVEPVSTSEGFGFDFVGSAGQPLETVVNFKSYFGSVLLCFTPTKNFVPASMITFSPNSMVDIMLKTGFSDDIYW